MRPALAIVPGVLVPGVFAAALAACGSTPMETPDTGPPAIALTVHMATMIGSAGAELPRPGYRFIALDITLAANTVGPIPLAAIAFEARLEDASRITASAMATNVVDMGCVSRSLPLGESASCRVVFEMSLMSAAPVLLVWTNGTYTVEADIPALS